MGGRYKNSFSPGAHGSGRLRRYGGACAGFPGTPAPCPGSRDGEMWVKHRIFCFLYRMFLPQICSILHAEAIEFCKIHQSCASDMRKGARQTEMFLCVRGKRHGAGAPRRLSPFRREAGEQAEARPVFRAGEGASMEEPWQQKEPCACSCRKVSLFRQGHEGTGASQALLFMTCCCNRHEKHDVSTMFLGMMGANLVARGRVQV